MDTITAETVKAFFAILLIVILLNVGAILYNVNQSNDYEKEVAQYIQKAGGIDKTIENKANALSYNYYHGMFYITPDSRPTVAKDTPVYAVPKDSHDNFMVAQRTGQMFQKTNSNLSNCPIMKPLTYKNGKKMIVNEGEIIKIDNSREINIPQAYQSTANGREVITKYIPQNGITLGKTKYKASIPFVIIKTPDGREGMINKELVVHNNDVKHLYGTRINYWVHERIPYVVFAKFKDNNVAIQRKYMTQTTSNYGRFATN